MKPPRSVYAVVHLDGEVTVADADKAVAGVWAKHYRYGAVVVRYDLHRPRKAKGPVAPPPPGYGCGACGKRRKGAK